MKTHRSRGFTLVEIMIVVAIIALLAAIAIPNFVKAKATSEQNACINNLKNLDAAAQSSMQERKLQPTNTYTLEDIKPFVKLNAAGNIPECPAGGTYSPGATFAQNPTCTLTNLGHELPPPKM